MKKIHRRHITEALGNAGIDHTAEILNSHESPTGRVGFGIEFKSYGDATKFFVGLGMFLYDDADEELAYELAGAVALVNTARTTIFFFPGWELED
ncbi:hypothetical protein ACIBCT_35390 [Streptosporangium sp. NPDC050855]|uniref:hypothetical protein n=1 Tax=Streptosporangium sp. NPDC050855 TaxID=3366194 RepID=UPI0037B2B0A2